MNKRQLFLLACLVAGVVALSRCGNRKSGGGDPRGDTFAAANTCVNCHKAIVESYAATAHSHTSAPASAATVKGSFTLPDNVFNFPSGYEVKMEREDSILYQAAYHNGALQQKQPFDIAVGSGRKAQTFLSWRNGQYFQLPISYFVPAASWANSPGFPADHPKFDRIIPSTCFGCHSSAVKVKEVQEGMGLKEVFEKREMIAGIDCQRCHGPAAAHVSFHTANPEEKTAKHIARIDTLANIRKLDMCALCHSGLKPFQQSPFRFQPGDALSDFLLPTVPFPRKPAEMDVHGNQHQLLVASQCFVQSKTMNCASCHNPHTTERDLQMFAQRCMSCHQRDAHQKTKLSAEARQQNCINCHMPALPSTAITLLANGQTNPTPDSIRTHLIAVYDDAAQRILAKLQEGK